MSNEIITINANKPIIERIYSFDSLSYFHSIHALNVHNVPKNEKGISYICIFITININDTTYEINKEQSYFQFHMQAIHMLISKKPLFSIFNFLLKTVLKVTTYTQSNNNN